MHSFGVLYSFLPLHNKKQTNGYATVPVEKPRVTKLTTDLQINYWELDDTLSSNTRYLDFGLMIKNAALDVEAVYFYFPFKIKSSYVIDLGSKLKNVQMVSALFNEDFNCNSNTGTPYTTVRRKGGESVEFYLYELAKTNFEVVDVPDYGSLLKISILSKPPVGEPVSTECNTYIRFRMRNIPVEELFYEEPVSNDYIQSAFYKTRMLDFRVNERREMNNKLLEVLETEDRHFVDFNKFHFYYIGSSQKEKIEGYVNYNDCRLLDCNTWAEYLSLTSSTNKKLLSYHWKKSSIDKPFQSCSVFMRTVFKSLNSKIIIYYSLIAIGLSFFASVLWGLLSKIIFKF